MPVGEPKVATAGGETGVVRILHLSDFHFSDAKRWDQDPVMRALLDDVEGLVKAGLGPHLIAVTGDIAQSGQRKEYARASEWFTELLKRTKLAPTDLLLVTGNHDVDRGEVKGKVEVEALQRVLLDAKSQEKIASALKQRSSRKLLLERHSEWHRFASKLTGTKREVPWWTLNRSVNGVPLHVAGFCSSWMSWQDNEQGSLLVGRWQVYELQPRDNGALTIALMHHPFSYFADWDGEEAEESLQYHYALVMRGHLHRQKQEQRVSDPSRRIVLVTAGSCYAGSKYPNAYQLMELRPDSGEARIHLRTWDGLKWLADRNAHEDGPTGVITRPLRRAGALGSSADHPLRSDGPGEALSSREEQIDTSRLANTGHAAEPFQIGDLTSRIEQMGASLAARLPASIAREVITLLEPMLVPGGSGAEGPEIGICEAKIGTARDLLRAGEIAAARTVLNDLERGIEDRSVPSRIRYRVAAVLGACALGDDDTVEVRRQFEKALALDPENPKAMANRALAALLDRDLDLACELAERALASMPRDGHAMGVLLQVLYHKGDQERLEALVGSEAWMQDELGCRAALGWIRFEQGRYPEAEKLLRAVVEAEPFNTSLRTALVGSIMGPIEADLVDAPLVGWATPADRRRRLDEAEGLQSETIRILEKRQQPEQLSTAILRRCHIRLLGDRQKEALSDCERVLSDAPERPDALRLRGIMALHEPDPDLAVSCLEKASRTFGLDVTIPLAEAHLLNGNPRRAAELLSPVLHQPKLGSRSLARAAEGLLLAYRRLGIAEGREEVLRALAQFAPDCPFALVIRAREAYRGGIAAEAERLLRTAVERAKPHERAVIILELGAFLDHAGRHGEAADCYREVAQTPGDTPGTQRLVVALYKAGRLREARDTAAKARGDGPPLVPATEIEATLRDIQGDLVGSRALWTRLAEHFPKNPRYVIQTALIDMRIGKESEARATLDQVEIESIEEDAEALVKAAQGRLALGMPDALEYCYQALRAGFDDPKTHMAYVTLFLRAGSSDFQQPNVVEEGTVVRFQVHGQEEEVLILRAGERARMPFEKVADDPAVRRLLGHKRGDEVLFGGSSLNPYMVTVTDIKNRHVAAYQDSMARFQSRFPDQNFVESITGDTAHTLTKLFTVVDAGQKQGRALASEYERGSLPIYALSDLTGRSVYEVWRSLALDSSTGVCASVPSPDPRSAHGVKGLVCDAVSLFTLQHLDALDVFFESCGPIFVPTQVRDELANALQSAVPLPGEAGSLQKTGDYFALVKTPDPSRNDACVFLQAILDLQRSPEVIHMCS
ncbi:MAG: tetratricopeptide repeat protein [Acidobacteria bacterium]|nr:tetratricopeptide repeat protein [Acidobacteriota bacterium]